MSLPIYRKLGLGDRRKTLIILQLADKSLNHPYESGWMLIKVGDLIFPIDFIILNIE